MTVPEGFTEPGSARSPFTIRQPVAWGEMDAMGHVNNTVYLRWLENARFVYFEHIGLNALYRATKQGPILARIELDFLAPVTFPDHVLVSTRTRRIGRSSFTLEHRAWSEAQGKLCAKADAVIVMVDYGTSTTIPVPQQIRDAITRLDAPEA